MKKIIALNLVLLFAYSCKKEDSAGEPMNAAFVEEYNNKAKVDSLCSRILNDGDTLAYKELKGIFISSENSQEFLYLSTVMAERYQYAPAYHTNYTILKSSKNGALKKLSVYNLLKAYELDEERDKEELEKMFPNGIPRSVDYLQKE